MMSTWMWLAHLPSAHWLPTSATSFPSLWPDFMAQLANFWNEIAELPPPPTPRTAANEMKIWHPYHTKSPVHASSQCGSPPAAVWVRGRSRSRFAAGCLFRFKMRSFQPKTPLRCLYFSSAIHGCLLCRNNSICLNYGGARGTIVGGRRSLATDPQGIFMWHMAI